MIILRSQKWKPGRYTKGAQQDSKGTICGQVPSLGKASPAPRIISHARSPSRDAPAPARQQRRRVHVGRAVYVEIRQPIFAEPLFAEGRGRQVRPELDDCDVSA